MSTSDKSRDTKRDLNDDDRGLVPPPASTVEITTGPTFKAALGWTFFDPANLLCIILMTGAGLLAFNELASVGSGPVWLVILYYACIAAFLRGYFFYYYYGGPVARMLVYIPLVMGILIGAAYWEDLSSGFQFLHNQQTGAKGESPGLHWSALLNCMSAIAITIHLMIPRRWLIRMTDDIQERVPENFGTGLLKAQDTEDL